LQRQLGSFQPPSAPFPAPPRRSPLRRTEISRDIAVKADRFASINASLMADVDLNAIDLIDQFQGIAISHAGHDGSFLRISQIKRSAIGNRNHPMMTLIAV
jgi:hypothetical protein